MCIRDSCNTLSALLLLLSVSVVCAPSAVERAKIVLQKTRRIVRTYEKKRPHAETTGNRRIHSRRNKKEERLPRAPECTDRAQTSTTVSGRPCRVDLLSILPKSARTKRCVRSQTKMTNTSRHTPVYAIMVCAPYSSERFSPKNIRIFMLR